MIKSTLFRINRYIKNLIAGLIILSFATLGSLAIVSYASNLQVFDSFFGFTRSTKSKDGYALERKIKKILTGEIQVEAGIDFVTVTNILPSASMQFFETFMSQASSAINSYVGIILQPLNAILDKVLGLVDNLLDMLDRFAEVLAGTRVAMGFLIYRDVEGDGSGSSNFMGSRDFAASLIGFESLEGSAFNSDFPKKEEMAKLIGDGVAWLDFMTVQRSMQNGVIGDFLTKNSQFDVFTGEDVKGQIVDALVGRKCESSKIMTIVPIFRDFMGRFNTCQQEVQGPIEAAMEARKQAVLNATGEKIDQYQLQPPADCKFGQYYEVTGDIKVKYEDADKGNLGANIASVGDKIKMKQIKPDECESVKQAKLVQTQMAASNAEPINALVASGGNGFGKIGSTIMSGINKALEGIWKDFLDKIMSRWTRLVNMIASIGSGSGLALWSSLIDIALNIRQKIKQGIQTLNKEYQDFSKQTLPNPKE
jgi:hypothetical protein